MFSEYVDCLVESQVLSTNFQDSKLKKKTSTNPRWKLITNQDKKSSTQNKIFSS